MLKRNKFGQAFAELWQSQIFDGRNGKCPATDQEFVKSAQGAKTQLDRGAPKIVSAERSQVAPEIVALKFLPDGRLS